MEDMKEVSRGIDVNIWRNMPNVLGAVRREVGRIERQVVESPEPSISSGYRSGSRSLADSPAPSFGLTPPPSSPITPDPEPFRGESPESIELRATPSPQLVPNAERRAESPQESTSEDRADVPLDSPPPEEEEGNLYEVFAYYAERKSRKFELLNRYFPELLNQRDNTGEDVDSGESQGEGSSSQEAPPPSEDSAASSSQSSQSASTSSQSDGPTSSGNPPRSASRRARHPTPSSRPTGLPPRPPPRSASSQSQSNPTAPRHSSTSPHDRARSSTVGSRSRHPRDPLSNRPERLSTAPGPRSSRQGRPIEERPDTPMAIPRRPDEDGELVIQYRQPGALCVGPSRESSPQMPSSSTERDLITFDDDEPVDSARSKKSESEYETADDGSARSSDRDSARTMIPQEEFFAKKFEDFLAKNKKRRDDDDDSDWKTAREAQPIE